MFKGACVSDACRSRRLCRGAHGRRAALLASLCVASACEARTDWWERPAAGMGAPELFVTESYSRSSSIAAVSPDTLCAVLSYESSVRCWSWRQRDSWLLGRGVGEGPGEFQRPAEVMAGRDGLVYVNDVQTARVTGFTPSGELVWDVSVPPIFLLLRADEEGLRGFVPNFQSPGKLAVIAVDKRATLDTVAVLDFATLGGFDRPGLAARVVELPTGGWLVATGGSRLVRFKEQGGPGTELFFRRPETQLPSAAETERWASSHRVVFGREPSQLDREAFETTTRPFVGRMGMATTRDGVVWIATGVNDSDGSPVVLLLGSEDEPLGMAALPAPVAGFALSEWGFTALVQRDDERVALLRAPWL